MLIHFLALIIEVAAAMNLDYRVPLVIVDIESGGDPDAIGKYGEVGLMQIMPREAGPCFSDRPPARLLRRPVVNLIIGCSILRNNLRYFGGDYRRAIAAYNLGIAGLERRGLDDPAARRYLGKFEKAWKDRWPNEPLPWENVYDREAIAWKR